MNYVGTNWERGNDLKPLIHHLQHPEKYMEEPPDVAPDKDKATGNQFYHLLRNGKKICGRNNRRSTEKTRGH